MLLTFRQGDKRRSVVLGGLTYHEFIEEAVLSPKGLRSPRRAELTAVARLAGGKLAAYVDSGAEREDVSGGVRLKEVYGTPYVFSGAADPALLSVAFDDREVVYEAEGLDPAKSYTLGFSWWDFNNDHRVESVYAVGGDGVRRPLVENRPLPAWVDRQEPAEQLSRAIPPEAYRDGKLKIVFAKQSARAGSNAVVSETWLWEGGKDYAAAAKAAKETFAENAVVLATLRASDPVGRRIAPGETWLGDDRCYIDLSAADPFTAMEEYGLAVRAAQKAKPNIYDFPTLCAWYVQDFTGGPKINNTAALVEEMACIAKTGFLKCSPVALRLVPDTYAKDSEQGWWDDAHWRKFGHYTPPYETSKKWCDEIRRRGGLPFTYFQTGYVSRDYAKAFPDHMLDKHPVVRLDGSFNATYDYSAARFSTAHARGLGEPGPRGDGGRDVRLSGKRLAAHGRLQRPNGRHDFHLSPNLRPLPRRPRTARLHPRADDLRAALCGRNRGIGRFAARLGRQQRIRSRHGADLRPAVVQDPRPVHLRHGREEPALPPLGPTGRRGRPPTIDSDDALRHGGARAAGRFLPRHAAGSPP